MSGRGRSVRRRVGQAVAKQTERGTGMRAAVDPAPAKEQRARWRRRNAAETATVPEPASAPVPGPKPEAAIAAAPPANVNAQTITPQMARLLISVIFSAQPMGYHVVTTWVSTRHKRVMKTKSYQSQVCLE
ncbi:hypothetical protein DPMN_047951 [Dreissena polymorpha]|uniref:Uncharacterized protein n=1 Tax=Dreissena polymorpha TaxID=45954 RepID=A0A9D4DAC8_DREPO|nr:hypothetical protein DPMN_047951 [Dreissena polymorpha]